MVARRLPIVLMLAAGVTGCTTANTVYLYDGQSDTAKFANETPVWKDAASAQSSTRGASIQNWGKVKCQVSPPASAAERKQSIGRAVEVRVHGGCTGFVNSAYVHSEK